MKTRKGAEKAIGEEDSLSGNDIGPRRAVKKDEGINKDGSRDGREQDERLGGNTHRFVVGKVEIRFRLSKLSMGHEVLCVVHMLTILLFSVEPVAKKHQDVADWC